MSLLGEGNLAGARAALRDIPPTLDRAALAVDMASGWGLFWALDSADRALLLTLPPAAFDNDQGSWALTRAELYSLASDSVRTRRYADTARISFEAQVQARPDEVKLHETDGLALAYLGRRTAAAQQGERGLALALATGDERVNIPGAQNGLARIYVITGDHPRALGHLGALLSKPYFISPAWLNIRSDLGSAQRRPALRSASCPASGDPVR